MGFGDGDAAAAASWEVNLVESNAGGDDELQRGEATEDVGGDGLWGKTCSRKFFSFGEGRSNFGENFWR